MAHLMTVSGSRVPLRPGHSYVMGRGRDCEIVVEDIACSRRHSLISLSEDGEDAFITDLGSRNGSFLNGERIMDRQLMQQGARVRIGTSVFLLHLLEAPEEIDFSETGTIGFEQSGIAEDIDGGELAHYGLVELLKLLIHSKRNLSLHVALPDDNAQVELRRGDLIAASCGGLDGFNALVKLGRHATGIFWVVENEDQLDGNIEDPASRVLVELTRCLGTTAKA